MFKRVMSAALAAALAVCMTAGCSGSDKKGGTGGEVSIKIGGWPSTESASYEKYESMKKDFMKKNPGIKLRQIHGHLTSTPFFPRRQAVSFPMYIQCHLPK